MKRLYKGVQDPTKRFLLVGTDEEAAEIQSELNGQGIAPQIQSILPDALLNSLQNVDNVAAVCCVPGAIQKDDLITLYQFCQEKKAVLFFCTPGLSALQKNLEVRNVGFLSLLSPLEDPLSHWWNRLAKRLFDLLVSGIFLLFIFPFIYIISASFATEYEITTRPMFIIPQDVTLNAYKFIFSSNKILQGFRNSIFITVCGTAINLFFTVTMAYALSKKRLRGRNFFLNMVIISMFFSGGMIPGYIIIANVLNLKNTFWAVLLPGAISSYNLMIVKNFFQGIPQELEESAAIDGSTDIGILWKIVLPLSLPVLATFGLFYAVGHWNAYFGAMIYMTGAKEKWPLQVLLRELIILANGSAGDITNMDPEFIQPPEQSVKMAVIVVSTVPIMCVYPFLQKYFVKGVMVGALKG